MPFPRSLEQPRPPFWLTGSKLASDSGALRSNKLTAKVPATC